MASSSGPARRPDRRWSTRSTCRSPTRRPLDAAAAVVAGARAAMGTPLDMTTAQTRSGGRTRSTRAGRPSPSAASACTNCTLVCPTCFCTSVVQQSDLDGTISTERADLGLLLHRRLREGRRRLVPAARQGSLPPVADPQVLDLVGPVRVERLRRLWPVHRLVPGRHRRPRGARGHRRRRARPDATAADHRDGSGSHRPAPAVVPAAPAVLRRRPPQRLPRRSGAS